MPRDARSHRSAAARVQWKDIVKIGRTHIQDATPIKAFSETDFTEDLKTLGVPVVIMHGDDDQIVPIADSALLSATDSGYKVELNTGIAIAWDIWPILPRPERRQAL
jgi:pimeloyl-ACP methyl ester carboxylesterase